MVRLLRVPAVVIVFVFVVCAGGLASAAPVTLARGGEPAATIVVPARAPKVIAAAAADLQAYVREICGVELPIVRDGRRVAGTGLYIGACEGSLDADLPDETLNPEAFAIRVRDGDVFFAARHPTPTCFAVMAFIEETLGVRWFAPGDDWEYVPAGTPGTLVVDQADVVTVPDTSPRMWSGHDFGDAWRRWNLRNKAVGGEVAPRRNFQNTLYRAFPPSKYAQTHPEYYPLINGQRWIPPEDYRYWRPCESNPDVLRLTIDYARRHFDRNPNSDSFSLGMDDIAFLCECPDCRAMDAHPDAHEKREFSDRHYTFVNAVAREIAKTHPDRYVGTLIYSIARRPPETVERLEDNVFAFMTEVSAMWCLPGRRDEDHALTRAWAARCKHLSRYEYFGLGTFTPRYYPHAMAEQMRFDKSLGFEGMYAELNTLLPHTAPMVWAFAKLQWDADRDIDALLHEFFTKMFGSAAPTMARYFDLLERAWNDPPPNRTDWEHRNIFIQAMAISPEAVAGGLELLVEAAGQADTPVIRRRIAVIRAALEYAGYAIDGYALSESLVRDSVSDLQQANRVLEQCLSLMELSSNRERFWAEAMGRDDLLGENLRGLAAKGYLMVGRFDNLERGIGISAARLLDWCGRHEPGGLPELKARLTESVAGGNADLVKAWLWVEANRPLNLVNDPGFEASAAAASPLPDTSMRSGGQPAVPASSVELGRWFTYSDAGGGRPRVEAGLGRENSAAACISEAGTGSTFRQIHEVRAGQRYLCIAWARAYPSGRDASGYLGIRFQKPDGQPHPRADCEPQVFMVQQEGWQRLMLLARVPDGAGRMMVQVAGKHQADDTTAVFDELGLYRLP